MLTHEKLPLLAVAIKMDEQATFFFFKCSPVENWKYKMTLHGGFLNIEWRDEMDTYS